jgi:hypothetical protein
MAPPKAGPAIKAGAKGSKNVLTAKMGPLPGWAWAAIALGGYYFWKQRKAAASSSTTATAQPSLPISDVTAPSGYGYQGPGAGGGSPFGPGWNVGTPSGATGTPWSPSGQLAQVATTIPYVVSPTNNNLPPQSNSGVPGVSYSAPGGINDPTFLTTPASGQVAIGGQNYPVGSTAANNAAISSGVNPASLYQL